MGRISVLGAGTWGTALAIELANKGEQVTLWSAVEREIAALSADRNHINNLPGAVLPASVRLTTDLEDACDDEEILVCAVASPYVRSTAAKMSKYCREGQIVVNVSKGVEEKGVAKGILSSIKNLMETMGLTIEQAMAALKVPEGERQKYMDLLERQ